MTFVADSGPLIHLAIVGQFSLLRRYFHDLLIVPQVYEEVVTHGKERPGHWELQQAVEEKWIAIRPVRDSALVERLLLPAVSRTDAAVAACALENQAGLVLADDFWLRMLAKQHGLSVMGSIGILICARLEGVIGKLKPLLDHLIAAGFHVEPGGEVYREALKEVGEM